MFRNILVPLDGSRLSEAALNPAAVLAQRLGSHVVLLHIIEQDPPSEIHRERHLTNADEAHSYLKEVAQRAFPAGAEVETHVHTAPVSDVAKSIVEHASNEFMPDLIVTCTHGSSGMRQALYGSIAQQVVSQGTTPLMLIRPESSEFRLDVMVAPLDPDSVHDDGLPLAVSLAKAFEAKLLLLSVVPTFSTLTGEQAATSSLMPATTQAMLDIREETARTHLRQHVDELEARGVKAALDVERGNPAPTIVKIADQVGANLIVLSTHGKAGVGAFWARSVAPRVAQRTSIPLLLIPLPAAAA